MSKDIRKLIHRIYGIALSAVIVIVGIRFIWGCYQIYTTGKAAGGQIYTLEVIAKAYAPMALSVYVCLALVIAGFLLHLALPAEKKKPVIEKNYQLILQRLQAKTDLAGCDPQLQADIRHQQAQRRMHIRISAILLAVCSVAFLVYACFPGRWPEVSHVIGTVSRVTIVMFVCLIAPTGYLIFTAYHCRKSLEREIELMKAAAKQSPAQIPSATKPVAKKNNIMQYVRYGIVAVALVMIILGYYFGGFNDVITKAAALCQECVGIG